MKYLILSVTILFLACEKTIAPPDTGRTATVEITSFEINDHTEKPQVHWTYEIEQFDESEPLDPVTLFVESHCDCSESPYRVDDFVMSESTGDGGGYGGITPPEEATEVWVVLRWVDDLGEHTIESDHLEWQP